ncbi:AcrR family transcriptional regulator [Rhizobium sp. BK512]|uniref:TetR/AcrR family transcriptional regulator n=1 Tax=Rhizobium sp. BK512 TaxID=2587010 RepID=UPI001617BE68|nr:TetR/AcrR family transcriptional regulator [Rhizobium sp. BK512]MBB3564368.1 AcrR family transcriptional regulator [Rhizobium sp. BK512]
MAKPKSDERRSAITSAAIRVIASQGLGAATATIAKEAEVSNGSLFTYFETKADLFNQIYIELKTEMASAALDGLPAERDIRDQLLHTWTNWLRWATSHPEKRRTLAHLDVCDEITLESHQIASRTGASIAVLLERSRANGPMRDAPLGFVAALMGAIAEATIDFIVRDPSNAPKHSKAGFEALWRIVA